MKQRAVVTVFALILLSAASTYAVQPEPRELVAGEDYVPGEVLVKISGPVHQTLGTEAQVKRLIESITSEVESVKPIFSVRLADDIATKHGLDRWFKVQYPTGANVPKLLDELRSDQRINHAEMNLIGHLAWVPNDPYFIDDTDPYNRCQWHLYNDDSTHVCSDYRGAVLSIDIDATEAWDIEKGDSTIKIGILDSGVDYDHEDLSAKILSGGHDFVNEDDDPTDENGHGTLVSGVAAAVTDNGLGVAGVCPNCMILPERMCDPTGCTSAMAAGALYHARDYGVDVINMSWGFEGDVSVLRDAISDAHDSGIVLVAAAGNDNDEDMDYPCAYDEVLCVAATDFGDSRLLDGGNSSNYGSWIDVAAPGMYIYTTKIGNQYALFFYTSSAAPQVAGEAGLILSKCPNLTKAEVESIIRGNVEPTNSPEYIGTGRINLWYALRSFCEDGTICPGLYECLPGGICKLPCDSTADCSSLGPTYSCVDGYCGDVAGVVAAESQGSMSSFVAAPHPFMNTTTIEFRLGGVSSVSLRVYDVSGRVVRTLASGRFEGGPHSITWDATGDSGERVSDGVYFCRLEAGDTAQTRKLVLTR